MTRSPKEADQAFPVRPGLLIAGLLTAMLAYPASVALGRITQPPAAVAAYAAPMAAKPERFLEGIKIKAGDTLARILTSRGHAPATVQKIVTSGPGGKELGNLKTGTTLDVSTDKSGDLAEIIYSPDPYRVVSIRKTAGGEFESEVIEKPMTVRMAAIEVRLNCMWMMTKNPIIFVTSSTSVMTAPTPNGQWKRKAM